MQFASVVVVNKSKEDIWNFPADPQNVSKWDRGVKALELGEGALPKGETLNSSRLRTMPLPRIRVE